MPHPNADRLVLCRLDDGAAGADRADRRAQPVPVQGPRAAGEAAQGGLRQAKAPRIYDGHQPGQVLTTLKRAKIRGVESYSMVCSEKELGISEEHEGIIILDDDAPVGMPLADYMGDAVLDIAITPNIARDCQYLGRGARGGRPHRQNACKPAADLAGRLKARRSPGGCASRSRNPELNPRFVLGLIEDVKIEPQPVPGAAPPAPGGHAPDQQHRRRHQLRHAGNRRAAARLRLRRAGAARRRQGADDHHAHRPSQART